MELLGFCFLFFFFSCSVTEPVLLTDTDDTQSEVSDAAPVTYMQCLSTCLSDQQKMFRLVTPSAVGSNFQALPFVPLRASR